MMLHLALLRRIPHKGKRWVATWALFDTLPWWWRWWPETMLERAVNRLEIDGLIESRVKRIEDAQGRGPACVFRWVRRSDWDGYDPFREADSEPS